MSTAQQLVMLIICSNIKGVKLYQQGNQMGYPVIALKQSELLELHFDDLDGSVKNYYLHFSIV